MPVFAVNRQQSDGRPLRYLYKTLGSAVLKAVPKAMLDAEMEKTNAGVDRDVLGSRFSDDSAYTELPATGA